MIAYNEARRPAPAPAPTPAPAVKAKAVLKAPKTATPGSSVLLDARGSIGDLVWKVPDGIRVEYLKNDPIGNAFAVVSDLPSGTYQFALTAISGVGTSGMVVDFATADIVVGSPAPTPTPNPSPVPPQPTPTPDTVGVKIGKQLAPFIAQAEIESWNAAAAALDANKTMAEVESTKQSTSKDSRLKNFRVIAQPTLSGILPSGEPNTSQRKQLSDTFRDIAKGLNAH